MISGSELQYRLLNELLMVKNSIATADGSSANITVPITEDLHLRSFPPVDVAHSHLDFISFRNSVSMSTEQQVMVSAQSTLHRHDRCLSHPQ